MRENYLYFLFTREEFFKFIQTKYLYTAATTFGLITFIFIVAIYIFLYNKKKRFYRNETVSLALNESISNVLLNDSNDPSDQFKQENLSKYLLRNDSRSFVIERLINIRKNLVGESSHNIPDLYISLGLKNDSLKKFRSALWYKKARGIYELYMMDQKDMIDQISEFTNDKNEYVRMEAQTASITFRRFKGLDFLSDLTQPIHQWQQLKILEQLRPLDPENFPHIHLWLKSKNDYVVLFALKIAEIYQQFSHHELIARCFESKNPKIRNQAISTLSSLDSGNTSSVFKKYYSSETDKNKELILKEFSNIGNLNDVPFLIEKTNEKFDNLKLNAARSLVKCSDNGWEILETISQKDLILRSILRQIKYEHNHERF